MVRHLVFACAAVVGFGAALERPTSDAEACRRRSRCCCCYGYGGGYQHGGYTYYWGGQQYAQTACVPAYGTHQGTTPHATGYGDRWQQQYGGQYQGGQYYDQSGQYHGGQTTAPPPAPAPTYREGTGTEFRGDQANPQPAPVPAETP